MGLAQRDNERHTYGDYLKWPEDTRYELIDGVAYLMAPAPAISHQYVAGEVFSQLKQALRGSTCRVLIAPVDVRLPKAGRGRRTHRHRGAARCAGGVRCRQAQRARRARPPDWVLEVLSSATAAHDQVRIVEARGELQASVE